MDKYMEKTEDKRSGASIEPFSREKIELMSVSRERKARAETFNDELIEE